MKKTQRQAQSKKFSNVKSDFNLKDVIEIGGTKEDFEMLQSVDENVEIIEENIENDSQDLHNEIKSFINQLGLAQGEGNCSHIDNDSGINEQIAKVGESKIARKTKSERNKIKNSKSIEKIESFTYNHQNHMLLNNFVPWYKKITDIPKSSSTLSPQQINKLHETAKQYWQDEVEFYKNERLKQEASQQTNTCSKSMKEALEEEAKDGDKSSDAQWLRTVLSSGTMSDKLAALTMITQESPIHCMKSLESLMNLAKKKSRREALIAVDSLRHIWIADLLPEIKLRHFHEYQLENLKDLSKSGSQEDQIKLLIMIAFEHELKALYEEFVGVLQNLSRDPLVNIRNKVIGIIYEMLVMKPEQEQKLLSILVNKLGDPDRKVASKASFLLCQLVAKHPNMQEVVMCEVERMLYRPNVSEKAQYYAIIFLNQIMLSHQKKHIASKLINIYFSFFKVLARKQSSKQQKPVNTQEVKLIGGLLTGVNRAFPYAKGEENDYEEQLNTLFKLTHIKHIGTSLQALMLIYQVMESREAISDRYYQALYEKLLDPEIRTSSKHAMFLNLLYKSLKNDPSTKRIKTFVKRLIQVCAKELPSLLCGVLFLLSEVMKFNPAVRSIIEQPEDEDDDLEHFQDVPDDDIEDSQRERENKASNNGDHLPKVSSWTFLNRENKNNSYNITHRNPLFAGGEYACAWEMIPMMSHFHPSVEHFAAAVLQGDEIKYKGDPLQDFTLIRFLDRFMYRNPKRKDKEHGHSIMQPKELSSRLKEDPVNSKNFLNKTESSVRQDELFFYRYFKQREDKQKKTRDENKEKQSDEVEQVGGELLEEFDFAGEMTKTKEELKKNKKKRGDEDSDDESSISEASKGDMDSGGSDFEFDYSDIDNESDGEDIFEGEKNFTDKDYEKALFENLNSDGESLNGSSDGEDGFEQSGHSIDNMFAAADEFAHMLDEESEERNRKGYNKQKQWEERKNNQWKVRKRNPKFHNKDRNFKQHGDKRHSSKKRSRLQSTEKKSFKRKKLK